MKIQLKKVVVIIMATTILFACKDPHKISDKFLDIPGKVVSLKFYANTGNHVNLPLNTLFEEDKVKFISFKPDNQNQGLLVNPRTIFNLEKKWFVYDPRNKSSSGLLFDLDGNFLTYVGTKGNGPGEYIATSLCRINDEKKRIEMVDGGTNKILSYDFEGHYIKSMPQPLLFTDFIPDPYEKGYYLYTLDNFNTGYMKDYGLEKDYVLTKTDTTFRPQYGIEEITLNPNANPYRNNGNKLFHFGNKIGFINNYSNDLYLISEDKLESLISFEIDGIEFQPKEYIKNADGNRFLKTLEKGFSFVSDLSVTEKKILEYIMVSSPEPNRKFDPIFLYYDIPNQDYTFYSELEDASDTYTIGQFYLNAPSPYDAYAMIQPVDIEKADTAIHPERQKLQAMWKDNSNNPIIALLKFK